MHYNDKNNLECLEYGNIGVSLIVRNFVLIHFNNTYVTSVYIILQARMMEPFLISQLAMATDDLAFTCVTFAAGADLHRQSDPLASYVGRT